MNDQRTRLGYGMLGGAALVLTLIALSVVAYFTPEPTPAEPPAGSKPPKPVEATAEQVHQFCGACHAYPPPDT